MFEFLNQFDLSKLFTIQSLWVVASLVVIEGLLSVDNALAIAAMVSHLEPKQRKLAMTIGYAGAYGFRIVALFLAAIIIKQPILMYFGAAYLIWLMCDHFATEEEEDTGEHEKKYHSFGRTIALIAALDLTLSLDNVVAALAFAPDSLMLVMLGVTIGIITLRFVAGYCIKLLEVYPWLEHTAFLLVGFVGCLLLTELLWDSFVRTEVHPLGISMIHADGEGDEARYHIEKVVKFGGIFLIIMAHLTFERVAGVKKVVGPLLLPIRHALAFVGISVSQLFGLITWPIRQLIPTKKTGEQAP